MPEFNCDKCSEDRDGQPEFVAGPAVPTDDVLMEEILENLNTTPLGLVLKKISSLPEIRRDKVLDVRRQLTDGRYELNQRLDTVLEKVLEELNP